MRRCLPFQAMTGTPADCAMMVEPILSPSACMGPAGGPMKRMGRGCTASRLLGSAGFSLAWPQPAHTASAPTLQAVSTMRRTFA